MTRLSLSFLLATTLALLVACTDATTTTTAASTAAPAAAGIALGTSTNFILTDNATAATLTATLVDSSNAVMPGVVISFSTTSGSLNASSATTDANGQAIVTLKSGLADPSNRTATVTATLGGLTASIPILIKGSTVAMTLSSNTVQVGAGTLTATATATKAGGLGVSFQSIRFSTSTPDTGAATLSVATLPPVTVPPATCTLTQAATCNLTTDVSGVVGPLTLTPTASGTVVLKAEWLDSAGAVTATTTQNISLTAASGIAFAITIPVANPLALSSSATQALAVSVPATISGTVVTSVRISATAGTWTGTAPATGPLTSIMQTPAAGAVAAIYKAPANSGSVTIQVDALSATGASLSSLSRTFAISAPATAAARIFLSSSVSTVVPSSGANISTATLDAVVRDVNNNTVGGAAVMFGLLGTTGSGESVSPAVAYTDSTGHVTSTFSAGASPTLASIYAQASIVGQTCTFVPTPSATVTGSTSGTALTVTGITTGSLAVGQYLTCATCQPNTQITSFGTGTGGVGIYNIFPSQANASTTILAAPGEANPKCDETPLMVSSSAVSIVIGFGTTIADTANSTQYQLPGSVLVVNSNGSPVAGIPVTLSVFPVEYRNGIITSGIVWTGASTWLWECVGPFNTSIAPTWDPINLMWVYTTQTTFTAVEDANRNGILDALEDTGIVQTPSQIAAQAISQNGLLSPPQAAGGVVPMTVTTDNNGTATFSLQYPKSSALFIKDEVTARVIVMGTESTAKTNKVLPMSKADNADATCPLAHESFY